MAVMAMPIKSSFLIHALTRHALVNLIFVKLNSHFLTIQEAASSYGQGWA